jgi:hypothetical protein
VEKLSRQIQVNNNFLIKIKVCFPVTASMPDGDRKHTFSISAAFQTNRIFVSYDLCFFRETLTKAFSSAKFALRSSKTAANSCASTGGSKEICISLEGTCMAACTSAAGARMYGGTTATSASFSRPLLPCL